MNFQIKIVELKKRKSVCYKCFLFSFFISVFSVNLFSQDSIPISNNQKEEQFLQFQEHFFKALAQKAVFNYRIAVQNLEKCNELQPNNVSVLFELSKNYFYLNKSIEAIAYAKQGLKIDSENLWLLEHLTTIYIKDKNFTEAIKIQEKLAQKEPKKNEQLVLLYFQNLQYHKGKELLLKLEKENALTPKLLKLKKGLSIFNTTKKAEKEEQTLPDLISNFNQNQSFETLQKILNLVVDKDNQALLKYSKKGIEIFPAQGFVYLMHGKALNAEKQFSKALESLQNGIDFVIENKDLEANFHEEMSLSYQGLGNKPAAIKSKNKALALRKKQ